MRMVFGQAVSNSKNLSALSVGLPMSPPWNSVRWACLHIPVRDSSDWPISNHPLNGIIDLSSMVETWIEDLLQWKAFIAIIIDSYGLPIRPVIELLLCIDDYQDSSKGNCVGSH